MSEDWLQYKIDRQIEKQQRMEQFREITEFLRIEGYAVDFIPEQSKYLIHSKEFEAVGYFPKSNKLHIQKSNTWIAGGLNWIKQELL